MKFEIRPLRPEDYTQTADLIYDSLNTWYLKNRGFRLVAAPKKSMLLFPKIYEDLDPGCCILAVDSENGEIAGSCFYHPRPTHVSLGMMNVHPNYFGKGAAGPLIRFIIDFAQKQNLPVRLVSSAMNLDSFALYNKYGFRPTIFFQDMSVSVPKEGVIVNTPNDYYIRKAVREDLFDIARLEKDLYSIDRMKDFEFFFENKAGIWQLNVLVKISDGSIDGFCAGVLDPGSNMVGPGIARTEEGMDALIRFTLNQRPETNPVVLIPSDCLKLRNSMFEIGARICELHVAQVLGEYQPAKGIVLPSFMPETS